MGLTDRIHIAVDMDDVVLDFTGGLRASIKKEFGVTLTPEDIDRWDLHEILDPILGGRSWWKWMEERAHLWSTFPAIEGAIGTLMMMRWKGHHLELVTSKPQWAEHSVYEWLGKWRPPFQKVTICTLQDKKVDCTDASVLIDDKPSNCQGFLDAGREALLFTRPHNAGVKVPRGMTRVGWTDIRERFAA